MTGAPTKPRKLSSATRALLRRTASTRSDKWGIGGRLKGAECVPRAISLPILNCQSLPADEHDHIHSTDGIAGRERR